MTSTLPFDLVAYAITFLDITEDEEDICGAFTHTQYGWRHVRRVWLQHTRVEWRVEARVDYYRMRKCLCHYVNGVLHSLCGEPAVIFDSGTREWYRHGALHRDNDMPAIVRAMGDLEWYKNGLQHRDRNRPAVVSAFGTYRAWYRDGVLHRDDGPAVINGVLSEQWCQRGLLHRDDGPAVTYKYGDRETYTWYFYGAQYDPNGTYIERIAAFAVRVANAAIGIVSRVLSTRAPLDELSDEI